MRKRHRGEQVRDDWLKLVLLPKELIHPACRASQMCINAWYAAHPKYLIGKVIRESNGYDEVPVSVFDGDLRTVLQERIAQLPSVVYQPVQQVNPKTVPQRMIAATGAKPGSYRLHKGRIHRVEGSDIIDVHDACNATQRARIGGMIAIRDHARALLDAQLAGNADDKLVLLRSLLNSAYDRFVAKYGYLSTRANALAFRRDPDYPLLLSLEYYDDDSGIAEKAAIFTRRTLVRIEEPAAVSEPEEALAASMQWRGRVDASYMAGLLNVPEAAVLENLSSRGFIFLDPFCGEWKSADDYLSGNVKEKLKQAVAAGEAFIRNVDALEQVIPVDLEPASIEPRLGAVWIPASDVQAFIDAVLELKDCDIAYSAVAGAWSIHYAKYAAQQNVKVSQEFGTSRMNAIELVQCALNVQVPTVRNYDPIADKYFVDKQETLAAREKLAILKDRFASWAFEEVERRERLCRSYNDIFVRREVA